LKERSFGSSREVQVTVKSDKIVRLDLLSGESLHTVDVESISIMSVFDDILDCDADDACVFDAEYDSKYGIPTSVTFDRPPIEDAWGKTEISDFRILP